MEPDAMKKQFIGLYHDESDSVFRFCLLRTSDREVALDITQDAFTRFWDALVRRESDIHNGRAFLFAIARNGITDWYRKKKSLSLDAIAESAEAEPETFIAALQDRHDIEMELDGRRLIEAINRLDPIYQQAVYLRYVEDLRPREIAKALGISATAVSVRIFRGMRQLKKQAGFDEPLP